MAKTKLLFLCTGNSCRSQMAEGLTRHLKGDIFEVFSAGVETHGLNPNAVKVMSEIGIDITTHTSDHINKYLNTGLEYVVTVCDNAKESCPIFPEKVKTIHVSFPDPPALAKKLAAQGKSEEEQLDCYRKVRDKIKEFVENIEEKLN